MSRRNTVLIGAFDGFFGGLTGLGGGAILVTFMVSLLGMSQHKAHGTSLAVIFCLSIFAAITYSLQGFFDLSIAVPVAVGSILGAVIGARLMAALPAGQLRRVFGAFLMFVSLSMLSRGIIEIGGPQGATAFVGAPFWLAVGFVTGVVSGLMGIGGGMVTVPVMVLVAGLGQQQAQGVSLAVIPITSAVGAYTHYRMGNVELGTAAIMGPSAIVTAIIASLVAGRIDPFWLTKIFGLVLLGFAFNFTFSKGRERAQATTPQTPPAPSAGPSARPS